MNELVLYAHGGSGNHGCEAIVAARAVWAAVKIQQADNNEGAACLQGGVFIGFLLRRKG